MVDASPLFEVERGACAEAFEPGREGVVGMPREWGSFFRLPTDFWAAEILDRVSASGVSGSSESTLATSSLRETPLWAPKGSGDECRLTCRRTLFGLNEVDGPEEIEGDGSVCIVTVWPLAGGAWEMGSEAAGGSAGAPLVFSWTSSLRTRDLRIEADIAG